MLLNEETNVTIRRNKGAVNIKLEWLGKDRYLVEKLVKFGNSYGASFQKERYYGSDIFFSPEEIQTLEYILENEEKRQHMSTIAKRLGMTPSTLSKNVKKMCDKGLLEKYHEIGNKKNVIVQASDKGRQVYSEYCKYVQKILFDDIFKELEGIPDEYIMRFANVLELWAEVYDKPIVEEKPLLVKIE